MSIIRTIQSYSFIKNYEMRLKTAHIVCQILTDIKQILITVYENQTLMLTFQYVMGFWNTNFNIVNINSVSYHSYHLKQCLRSVECL